MYCTQNVRHNCTNFIVEYSNKSIHKNGNHDGSEKNPKKCLYKINFTYTIPCNDIPACFLFRKLSGSTKLLGFNRNKQKIRMTLSAIQTVK